LKILYLTSELAPLVVTGGLADVAAALPAALKAQGHDVRIAMPCYRNVPAEHRGHPRCMVVAQLGPKRAWGQMRETQAPFGRLPLYLIEHAGYFDRPRPYGGGDVEYTDNAERFAFFCIAALDGIRQTGWRPDVVHSNDWHTAVAPACLRTVLAHDAFWRGTPSLLTIHNLAFQGRYGAHHFPLTGLPPELLDSGIAAYEGDMNLLKAAIHFATRINTVSPRYALEVQTQDYGEGLHDSLRARAQDLCGILNGVDYAVWHPSQDKFIAEQFSAEATGGKRACKRALQQAFGLPERDVPLFGVVSRLHWQKGMDLVAQAMDGILAQDTQIVLLGTGDPAIERQLAAAAARHPGQAAVHLGFDNALAHQVYAGSDFFLMPSRYEPCGLSQMYSLAYGTLPIVRRTGGLADSVRDCNPVHLRRKTANGISFVPRTPQALVRAVTRALALYRQQRTYRAVQQRAMADDFSWKQSCLRYVALYESMLAA
jgi:starch synthase